MSERDSPSRPRSPAAVVAAPYVLALLVLALFVLALALRVATLLVVGSGHASEEQSIARHLLSGHGFAFTAFGTTGPTSARPPVYPVLLALVDGAWPWLNALAGAASSVLAYLLARQLSLGSAASTAFALLIAIVPTQLIATTYPQGLSLAVPLMLAAMWLATFDSIPRAVAAGLCAGLAVLTESILLLPLLLALGFLARRRPASLALALLACGVLVGPWLYRNSIVHRQFTGITTTLGPDLFQGNGDDATGSHLPRRGADGKPLSRVQALPPRQFDELRELSEIDRAGRLRERTADWIAAHPLAYAQLCAIRLAKTLWMDWHHPLAWNVVNVATRTAALLGFLAALVVAIRNSRRVASPRARDAVLVAMLVVIGLSIVPALTLAEARNAVFVEIGQLLAIATLFERGLV